MQNIFEAFQLAAAMYAKEAELAQQAFGALPIEKRLELALSADGSYLDKVLAYETYYSGSDAGANVSLYDDFNWDRHETRDLSDIVESVCDNLESATGEEETLVELAPAILEAAKNGEPRASVLVNMLERGIGRACHDW